MTAINALLGGAIVMASLVIALFFLRFWRSTGDRFFLFFALSFILQAIGRLSFESTPTIVDDTPLHYVLRIVAYGLILFAVVMKNRRSPAKANAEKQP
jgi:predicted permease